LPRKMRFHHCADIGRAAMRSRNFFPLGARKQHQAAVAGAWLASIARPPWRFRMSRCPGRHRPGAPWRPDSMTKPLETRRRTCLLTKVQKNGSAKALFTT
jgi:hypothetical protein